MPKKIVTTALFFLLPFLVFAQKKTLLKLEFPVGIHTDIDLDPEQRIIVMYPTLYVPVHKHLDIGASYNNLKLIYYVEEVDPTDLTSKYYKGDIKYKVTSFYLKINLSASQKRVNPFFGYVLSMVKGDYTAPSRDSISDYYDYDYYSKRMTPSEEAVLKKSLNRSQIAHGFQLGVDFKILPFLNLFVKSQAFSLAASFASESKEQPFSINYKDEYKAYLNSPMVYYMLGIILKIDAGKKSLIK